MARVTRVPANLAAAPLRTVRPLMLRGDYANPEKELVRLRNRGQVVRIAPGTYTVKPDHLDPTTAWRPNSEEAAMAYATAQYGNRIPVLYGIGAARFHHAIPRAIGVTVVAVPEQHRPVQLADGAGRVIFTKTDVARLDARLEAGAIGRFLVTTPEQTLVDLLARPDLGGLPQEAAAAIRALVPRVDAERTRKIAAIRGRTMAKKVDEVLD